MQTSVLYEGGKEVSKKKNKTKIIKEKRGKWGEVGEENIAKLFFILFFYFIFIYLVGLLL